MKREADEMLTPATDDQVAILVERLRANYAEFDDLSDAVLAMVLEDMLNDLAGYPIKFLVEACRLWRNSPATRAPTAGQLKAMVAKEHRAATDRAFDIGLAISHLEKFAAA